MNKQLILRCGDGRTTIDNLFQTMDFKGLGVIEAPHIATTVPEDIGFICAENGVYHILALVHTQFPQLNGCGGLNGFAQMQSGESLGLPQLEAWLDQYICCTEPFYQAKDVGAQITQKVPEAIAITVCLVGNTDQIIFPIGHRAPMADWLWVENDSWEAMKAAQDFDQVPFIPLTEMNDEFSHIIAAQWNVNQLASQAGIKAAFAAGQGMRVIVLNGTPYPPTSYDNFRRVYGITDPLADAYFSIYAPPLFPGKSVAQLDYALAHSTTQSDLWVIAHSDGEMQILLEALARSELYRQWTKMDGLTGQVFTSIEQPPY